MRHLWRWSCLRISEAAAAATPSNRYEAALYGALGSHVAAVLPVCGGWEDECWAYCRAWLDLRAEAAVPSCAGALQSDVPADQVAALNGQLFGEKPTADGRRGAAEVALEAVAAANGGWPPQRLYHGANGVQQVPGSFSELARLLAGSANAAVRATAGSKQRALQAQLMSEQWDDAVLGMAHWALAANAGAPGAGSGGGQQGEGEGPVLLRFAAHLALALRALGLAQDRQRLEGVSAEQEEAVARCVQRLLRLLACCRCVQGAGWWCFAYWIRRTSV